MKTLNDYLKNNIGFEPSKIAKDHILASTKDDHISFSLAYDLKNIKTFFSYDLTKHNGSVYFIFAIYIFELVGFISIFQITSDLTFIIIKVIIMTLLIFLDIIISNHNVSKDSDMIRHLRRKKYSELTREYFSNELDDKSKLKINSNIEEDVLGVSKIERFKRNMLIVLFLIAISKVIVFYLDYWYSSVPINFKDGIELVSFYGTPFLYLIIPVFLWIFYGKYLWTDKAISILNKELDKHDQSKKTAIEKQVGNIENCAVCKKIKIDLYQIINNQKNKDTNEIEGGDKEINKNNVSTFNFKEATGEMFSLKKEDDGFYLNFLGLLSDEYISTIVATQDNPREKEILLCLLLSLQYDISHRESKTLTYSKNEKHNSEYDIELNKIK